MNFTEDEIIDALASEKLKRMVELGTIVALANDDGSVALVYRSDRDMVCVNNVKVIEK